MEGGRTLGGPVASGRLDELNVVTCDETLTSQFNDERQAAYRANTVSIGLKHTHFRGITV